MADKVPRYRCAGLLAGIIQHISCALVCAPVLWQVVTSITPLTVTSPLRLLEFRRRAHVDGISGYGAGSTLTAPGGMCPPPPPRRLPALSAAHADTHRSCLSSLCASSALSCAASSFNCSDLSPIVATRGDGTARGRSSAIWAMIQPEKIQ